MRRRAQLPAPTEHTYRYVDAETGAVRHICKTRKSYEHDPDPGADYDDFLVRETILELRDCPTPSKT